MVGWHHGLNGHEFKQAPGVGEEQGSLACFSPWGHKESILTETELRQCFEKQRHYSADKGQYSQGYGLPSGHVWL